MRHILRGHIRSTASDVRLSHSIRVDMMGAAEYENSKVFRAITLLALAAQEGKLVSMTLPEFQWRDPRRHYVSHGNKGALRLLMPKLALSRLNQDRHGVPCDPVREYFTMLKLAEVGYAGKPLPLDDWLSLRDAKWASENWVPVKMIQPQEPPYWQRVCENGRPDFRTAMNAEMWFDLNNLIIWSYHKVFMRNLEQKLRVQYAEGPLVMSDPKINMSNSQEATCR